MGGVACVNPMDTFYEHFVEFPGIKVSLIGGGTAGAPRFD
jgi:hypothetical protein